MLVNLPTCGECAHFFDPEDDRAVVAINGALCPACTMIARGAYVAWAVRNDCQGVFVDSVRAFKVLAEQVLQTELKGVGGEVVPVAVLVLPQGARDLAEIEDAERMEWQPMLQALKYELSLQSADTVP